MSECPQMIPTQVAPTRTVQPVDSTDTSDTSSGEDETRATLLRVRIRRRRGRIDQGVRVRLRRDLAEGPRMRRKVKMGETRCAALILLSPVLILIQGRDMDSPSRAYSQGGAGSLYCLSCGQLPFSASLSSFQSRNLRNLHVRVFLPRHTSLLSY
jgi:hypothetical protein